MQPHNFSRTIRNMNFLKLVLIIAILLAGILFILIDPRKPNASDFMLIAWNPAHELLTKGSIYAGYPYPVWTVVVMLPFAVWSPQTAMVLWFICNLLMLATSLALFVSIFEWDISLVFFAFVIGLFGFFLPVLTSIWLGQLTIFSLLILMLTTHLFLNQRWTWLGIIIGLSFIKPQVMILLAGLLLLWALWQRCWQTLLGFSMTIIFLTLISLPFASSPAQLIGGGISNHLTIYIQKTSTLWGLLLSLGVPWLIPLVISLALLTWLGWIWLPFLRGIELSQDRVIFLFSTTTIINLIAIPYSWMHNLVLLLLPLGYSIFLALKVTTKARFIWLILLVIIMYPLMYSLFVILNATQSYLIIPALVILPIMLTLESQTIRSKV